MFTNLCTTPIDSVNGQVGALDAFHAAINDKPPSIMAAAGVHLLQEQETSFRAQRLKDVRKALEGVTKRTAIHFEV